jgi:protein TonB
MPLIVDTTWYPAAQLDVFPTALAPVRPAYPRSAAEADVAGAVTLLLLIDETGRVHDSAVMDAQPENTFEEAALEAFRLARFTPGQRDGRSVRSRVLVKVVFNPAQAAP